MKIEIIVPTGADDSVTVTLELPTSAVLDDIHDDITKYVKCTEIISYTDGVARAVPVRLDGCVTTENYLSVFDVACEMNNDTKAHLRFS